MARQSQQALGTLALPGYENTRRPPPPPPLQAASHMSTCCRPQAAFPCERPVAAYSLHSHTSTCCRPQAAFPCKRPAAACRLRCDMGASRQANAACCLTICKGFHIGILPHFNTFPTSPIPPQPQLTLHASPAQPALNPFRLCLAAPAQPTGSCAFGRVQLRSPVVGL